MSMTHCMTVTAYTGFCKRIQEWYHIEDHILEAVHLSLPSTLVRYSATTYSGVPSPPPRCVWWCVCAHGVCVRVRVHVV